MAEETKAPKPARDVKIGEPVVFIDRNGKPVKATVYHIEKYDKTCIGLKGDNNLTVVGVPYDAEGKKLESWHFAPSK